MIAADETDLFRTILDSADANVMVCDGDNCELLYVSGGVAALSGSSGDYRGRTCYDYFMNRSAPCESCNRSMLKSDCAYNDEFTRGGRSYRRSGKLLELGERTACIERFEDITEQRESLRREQSVIENVAVGLCVFRYDADGKVTLVNANPEICNLLGVERGGVMGADGQRIMRVVHPGDREFSERRFAELSKPGCSTQGVVRHINRLTGEELYLLVRGKSVLESGSVTAYLSYTDVTEQLSLSEQLRESGESLSAAVKHSGLLYWEIDIAQKIAYLGEGTQSVYSIKPTIKDYPEFVFARGMIYPDDIACYRENVARVMKGEEYAEWDSRCLTPDKSGYSWLRTRMSLLRDNSGRPFRVIATAQNINEAKLLENNFVRAQTQNGIMTWELDLKNHRLTRVGKDIDKRSWIYGEVVENVPESLIDAGLFHEDSIATVRSAYYRIYNGEAQVTVRIRRWQEDKKLYGWYELILTCVDDGIYDTAHSTRVTRAIVTSREITAEMQLEQRYRDELEYRKSYAGAMISNCCIDLTRGELTNLWLGGVSVMSGDKKELLDFRTRAGFTLTDIRLDDNENAELSPENLLRIYENGLTSYEKTFLAVERSSGMIIWVRTEVRLLGSPLSGDVMAFFYNHNVTRRVMGEMTARAVASSSYELTGYIVVKNKHFYLEDYDWSRSRIDNYYPDYDKAVRAIIDTRIPAEKRDAVYEAQRLATITEQLSRQTAYVSQYRYIEDDGSQRIKATRYTYGDEGHEFIIVTRADNTELFREEEKQQQALHDALTRANSASKAKSDFLSIISHDIRTPLNAIMGYTALMLDEAENTEAVRDYLTKLRSSSDFLMSLINDILDMAKIEQGAVVLRRVPLNYGDFIAGLKTIFVPKCEQGGIKLLFEDGDNNAANLTILVDKTRLNQIFLNIFSNAVKYTPEGGTVTYRTENFKIAGGHVTCDYIISDTGIGMSDEFLKKLFTPFTQEDNSVTPYLQGTGLGLSITKSLVELMGGNIEIKSEQGKGTTVKLSFMFPIASQGKLEAAGSAGTHAEDYGMLSGLRVLLVEDNPINCEIAERMLAKVGVKVTAAENGKLAVSRFAASRVGFFDAVLMDIRMPFMDGNEATRAIRALKRADAAKVPIIAMSANAYDADKRIAYSAGMNDYLTKPVAPAELFEALKRNVKE